MCLDPFYCAVLIDLEGKSKCVAHLLCLKLFGQFCKEKEAVIGWLRVDREQTDFSFFLLPFMVDAILSSLLPPQALMFLRLQGNQLLSLPPQEKWTCQQLKTLDLSRNQLGK